MFPFVLKFIPAIPTNIYFDHDVFFILPVKLLLSGNEYVIASAFRAFRVDTNIAPMVTFTVGRV
jgi:hypothetical protein